MLGSTEFAFSSDSNDSGDDFSDSGDTRLGRRNLRDALNVFEVPEDRFVATFRLNKEMFKVLLDDASPKLKVAYRNTHILPSNALATFLIFLGTGGYQASIGNEWASSMCKATVSKAIQECLDVFEEVLCPKWINLATTVEEENSVKEAFYSRASIPGVVGCIDGTHVRIRSPENHLKHLYHNYKSFYSINAMAICDHNIVIKFVDARHPGCNHDTFIWEQSAAHHYFKTNFLKGKRNTWLLGDGAYKLQPYMMSPYRNPTEAREKKFNEKHCRLRNVIERCFGVLKNRFRYLIGSRGLHYSPSKVTQMINVCCALHNMCIYYKNNWAQNDIAETNEEVEEEEEEDAREELMIARSIRDQISRNL